MHTHLKWRTSALYQGAYLRSYDRKLFTPSLKLHCFQKLILLSQANKKSQRNIDSRIRSNIVVGITVVVDIANVSSVVRSHRRQPPVTAILYSK